MTRSALRTRRGGRSRGSGLRSRAGRSGLYVIYPAIVLVGTTTFFGFLAGVMPGDPDQALGTLRETAGAIGAIVAMVAVFLLMISPLLVIWWLTRPGERQANRWGPPVA